MDEKNVYQKIQSVRADLVALGLKKTGKNDYSNYTYYELGDFLPSLNKLMNDQGLCTRFVIQSKSGNSPEKAVLEVFNSAKPEEKITFYSETAEVEIGKKRDGSGGAESIQNLGGKITYMRRYLLMIAFEIIESDSVDRDRTKTAVVVDPALVTAIAGAKNPTDLTDICTKGTAGKPPAYKNAVLSIYTKRKNELERSV